MEHKTVRSLYPADVIEQNMARGGRFNSGLFFDKPGNQELGAPVDPKFNSSVIVPAGAQRWEQSKKFDELWGEIEKKRNALKALIRPAGGQRFNAAQFPADYYTLVNLLRLDITRRRIEAADMTSRIAQETTRLDASKSIEFNEFLPYAGAFEEIKGRGDKVPMMQHTTGLKGAASVKLYGLGDARTLEDELFNLDIYQLAKATDAFVRAHTAKRNDLTLGAIIAATYLSDQTVAADTTGTTAEEKLYITLNNAIEKLRILKDYNTKLEIDASRMVLMCAYADERRINRVINSQLDNSKGKAANFTALGEITEIWPYKGDVIKVGDRQYTYAGVAVNSAYLFIPGAFGAPNYVCNKRPLTYETGRGDLLALAREERVAYFGQAEYSKEFFGHSGGLDAGTGYVVKIALPA